MEIVISKNPRVRKDGKKVKPEYIAHSVWETVDEVIRPYSFKLRPMKEAIVFTLVSLLLYNILLFLTKSEGYSGMIVASWVSSLLFPYVLSLLVLKNEALRTKTVAYILLVLITIWNLLIPVMPNTLLVLSFLFCFNAFIAFLAHFLDKHTASFTAQKSTKQFEDFEDAEGNDLDDVNWDEYPDPHFSLKKAIGKIRCNLLFANIAVRRFFLASYYSGDSNDQSIASQHILFALRNKSCMFVEVAIYFGILLALFFPAEPLSICDWILFVVSLACLAIVSLIMFSLLLLTVDAFGGILTRVITGDDLHNYGAQNFVDFAFKRFINANHPQVDNTKKR